MLITSVAYSLNDEIQIYPNPARDLLYVNIGNIDLFDPDINNITVSDLLGKILISQSIDFNSNNLASDYETAIDVSGLPAGTFIIRVRAGMQFKTGIFIIIK